MLMPDDRRQFGDAGSPNVFIQLVDAHDMALMEREAAFVRELSGGADWRIDAIPVSDWQQDLTPWRADPVFGRQGFGDGAPQTLRALLDCMEPDRRCCLCGYSLAGLFALWAGCQTNAFAGIAAASPSVWYPNWLAYAGQHRMRAPAVYLSLGDRESRAKNPVMATVGEAIRGQHALLEAVGVRAALEWNPGNHFADSDLRMAKGVAWLLKIINGGNG